MSIKENHEKKIVFFASGNGTNVENILNYFKNDDRISILKVFTNNSDAGVLKRIASYRIKSRYFNDSDFKEGFNTDNCPNLLIQKGSEIHLVNSNKAEVPGVNPITFKNLEEYVEYMKWMKANNINCLFIHIE